MSWNQHRSSWQPNPSATESTAKQDPRRHEGKASRSEPCVFSSWCRIPVVVLCLVFCLAIGATAKEPAQLAKDAAPSTEPPANSVEKLTESARKSVVVITFTGRDGKQQGLGSGFVIAPDGLIATNLHVIGEARPITVQLADGKSFDVKSVEAFDRNLDLALLKIDAKELPALPLGDSETLKQGQPIIALGNPHGLKHSVVAGVVSGTREIGGRPMIQLAIPIEPGNSGGPLLDMQGRVHGILTMKSLVTENLGFAVAVNSLKPLIEKPNPTIMARWLTIGALDPKEWTTRFGGGWRQRAGRILVDGPGQGFGGRSLCLSEQAIPDLPFEIAVTVKLDQEEGAAGLIFFADGADQHFGFYPSNGKLRLTRFDGADVFSWKVLHDQAHESYRRGDWNTLKVRLEKGKIQCFVNEKLAIESMEPQPSGLKVGLAKFRNTEAEFKSFKVAKEIAAATFPDDMIARLGKLVDDVPLSGATQIGLTDKLVSDGTAGVAFLRERAKRMEQQAVQLRQLATAVHERRIQNELVKVLEAPEADVDLFHAALLVAQLDNDEVDVEAFRKEIDRMARDVAESLPKDADEGTKLAALNKYLYDEHGFHGSRADYYNKSNSYVNEVLDDREGLPITLSVVYMELARRLGVKVVGVGLPGHFVVRHEPAKGDPQLIDAYEKGQKLSPADAEKLVLATTGAPLKKEQLAAASKRAIIIRILHNLLGLSQRHEDMTGMLRYVDTIVALAPEAGEERWMRAVIRFQTGRRDGAIADTDWLLEHKPAGVDLGRVNELRQLLDRPAR